MVFSYGVNGRDSTTRGVSGSGLSDPVDAVLALFLCESVFSSAESDGVERDRNMYGLTSKRDLSLTLPKRCTSNTSREVAMCRKSTHDENLQGSV